MVARATVPMLANTSTAAGGCKCAVTGGHLSEPEKASLPYLDGHQNK